MNIIFQNKYIYNFQKGLPLVRIGAIHLEVLSKSTVRAL